MGTDFVWIQGAVDAAAPGDVILVRGSCTPQGGAMITRGLHLIGEGGVALDTAPRIAAIGEGARVTVQNLTMVARYEIGVSPIECVGCDGTLHLADVRGAGSRLGPGLRLDRCAQVTAVDWTFDAGETLTVLPGTVPRFAGAHIGLVARASAVALTRCRTHGSFAQDLTRFLGSFCVPRGIPTPLLVASG